MANCISCGRELRTSLFGSRGNVCQDCRTNAIDMHMAGSTATPMPRPRAASRELPRVTTVLVGINVAVFVMMLFSGVPLERPTIEQLLKWGADWGPLSLGAQPWRILTSNYLHIGIIHIGLNMWCLWNLGVLAERIFDRWTYVFTYTACGIAGSLGSLWWHPRVVGAGASGAIFGLAGALITALYLGKLPIPKQAMRGTMKSLVAFAGYNLLFGAVGADIDNSAHVGGLVTGLILGALLARHLTDLPDVRSRWNLGIFAVTAVILFLFFNALRHANSSPPPLPSARMDVKSVHAHAEPLLSSLFAVGGRQHLGVMSAD
ncbi:MAG: rhomboid family intramembrane serine protease [Terriglobales bacterium]|jgi:rhomboid protease GluP